jgi:catechol 2,3-dioxygenase-like lactoylglutathione lyase family enzyme
MTIELQKPALDLGIITNNLEPMLAFYQDTLGLPLAAVIDMPGGGVMHRYKVGESVLKIIETEPRPSVAAAPGGIRGATGLRYLTLHVTDLDAAVNAVQAAGQEVVVAQKTIRPGVNIAIVTDPDGNWVELLNNS